MFRSLAYEGSALAQFFVGSMYLKGQGVLEDDRKAVNWYRKAAEQGYEDAQFNLGLMYFEGRGVHKNDVLAYAWSTLAADQGLQSAIKFRASLRAFMSADLVAEGEQLSRRLLMGGESKRHIAAETTVAPRHRPPKLRPAPEARLRPSVPR